MHKVAVVSDEKVSLSNVKGEAQLREHEVRTIELLSLVGLVGECSQNCHTSGVIISVVMKVGWEVVVDGYGGESVRSHESVPLVFAPFHHLVDELPLVGECNFIEV